MPLARQGWCFASESLALGPFPGVFAGNLPEGAGSACGDRGEVRPRLMQSMNTKSKRGDSWFVVAESWPCWRGTRGGTAEVGRWHLQSSCWGRSSFPGPVCVGRLWPSGCSSGGCVTVPESRQVLPKGLHVLHSPVTPIHTSVPTLHSLESHSKEESHPGDTGVADVPDIPDGTRLADADMLQDPLGPFICLLFVSPH